MTLDPSPPKMTTVLGKTGVVIGNVTGTGDVEVRGRVQGSIELNGRVLVSDDGVVQGGIEAVMITVAGEVRGDLIAEDGVVVRASGQVTGNIAAPRVGIEAGARVLGNLRTGEAPVAVDRETGAAPPRKTPPRVDHQVAPTPADPPAAPADSPPAAPQVTVPAVPTQVQQPAPAAASSSPAEPTAGAEGEEAARPPRKRRRRRSAERTSGDRDPLARDKSVGKTPAASPPAQAEPAAKEVPQASSASAQRTTETPRPKKAKPRIGAKMPTFKKGTKGRQKAD